MLKTRAAASHVRAELYEGSCLPREKRFTVTSRVLARGDPVQEG